MHATLRNYKLHHITIILGNHLHNTHDHDRNIKLGSCWDRIFHRNFIFITPQKFSYERHFLNDEVSSSSSLDRTTEMLRKWFCALIHWHLAQGSCFSIISFPFFRNIHKKILCQPAAKLGQIRESLSDQFAGTFLILLPRLKKTHVETFSTFFHHFLLSIIFFLHLCTILQDFPPSGSSSSTSTENHEL